MHMAQTKLSGVKLASHQMAANMATNIAEAKTIDLQKKKNRRAESDKGAYSSTRRPFGTVGLGFGFGPGVSTSSRAGAH